jgi:hypothetical protein
MLEKGVIRESCSPWASPVVIVPKKDGSKRFCIDFRKLNLVTKKDVYQDPEQYIYRSDENFKIY